MAGFADTVSEWARESEDCLLRVFQTAVGDLATQLTEPEPDGLVPHKTGNLANSLLASKTGPVMQGATGEEYKTPGVDAGALAADLDMGDVVWLGYRANYAHRLNYGFVGQDSLGRNYNQAGRHFVEAAVNNWPRIVAEAERKVRGS